MKIKQKLKNLKQAQLKRYSKVASLAVDDWNQCIGSGIHRQNKRDCAFFLCTLPSSFALGPRPISGGHGSQKNVSRIGLREVGRYMYTIFYSITGFSILSAQPYHRGILDEFLTASILVEADPRQVGLKYSGPCPRSALHIVSQCHKNYYEVRQDITKCNVIAKVTVHYSFVTKVTVKSHQSVRFVLDSAAHFSQSEWISHLGGHDATA